MAQTQVGMIGLGVMGENLALNIEEHGFPVAVWNREPEKVDEFVAKNAGKKITGTKTLQEFTKALTRPRRIMMMIKAGSPVDETLEKIMRLLERGDVVIDGGNSWFKDTQERTKRMESKGFHFVGSGVSGGEEGARHGPSLMPGGSKESWKAIQPVFEAIAAKSDSGPCVTHVGPDGAGHFVKMVHNGIEYGDMQLIAEAYDLLRRGLGLSVHEIAAVFEAWNQSELRSYLIEITAQVLTHVDADTGQPLVDVILDEAEQKGTGKWMSQNAFDVGAAIPTVNAAVEARLISALKTERVTASKILRGPSPRAAVTRETIVDAARQALYASKVTSYAQGM